MNKTEIVKLTADMVEIPSITTDQEACVQVLDLCSDYLSDLGLEVIDYQYPHKDFPDLLVNSRLWGHPETLLSPTLLLNGHIDVVQVGENEEHLFNPRINDNIMYGRGTGDMKGHVAAMLVTFRNWVEAHGSRGVGLLITGDEEYGGFGGTRKVVEAGLKPEIAFVADGEAGFNIIEKEKAPHHFIFEATGSGGHASHSYRLENPIHDIIDFYADARAQYDVATNEPGSDWASTFAMTVFHTPGHDSKNKIANTARAAFSWRFPPEQLDFSSERENILRLAKKHNLTVILEEGGGEGYVIDRQAEYVQLWKQVIENIIEKPVDFEVFHGASDTRHFVNAHHHNSEVGTTKVLNTSARAGEFHESDEWVDVDSLVMLSQAIYQYIQELLLAKSK